VEGQKRSVGVGTVVVGVIRKKDPVKQGDLYWKMGSEQMSKRRRP